MLPVIVAFVLSRYLDVSSYLSKSDLLSVIKYGIPLTMILNIVACGTLNASAERKYSNWGWVVILLALVIFAALVLLSKSLSSTEESSVSTPRNKHAEQGAVADIYGVSISNFSHH